MRFPLFGLAAGWEEKDEGRREIGGQGPAYKLRESTSLFRRKVPPDYVRHCEGGRPVVMLWNS